MTPPPHSLRVMMTCDAVGGVWTYAVVLARELCRLGCQVTLVVLGPQPRPDQMEDLRSVSGLELIVTDLALEWEDPAGVDIAHARDRLETLARRMRPHIVHLNGFREACFDWPAPVIIVAHSCVRSWWLACRGGEPTEDRWQCYIANVRDGLAAAKLWVAPTQAFRDQLQKLYGPVPRGRAVWNGIVPPIATAPKEPIVLAAGRIWDEGKNLSLLAAVAPDLPWPVQMVGSPAHATTEAALPPARNLQLLGEMGHGNVLELMNRAAVYVAPSVYEPFGLTVLEAAASGCALVLSDIPTFRELWDGAAFFVAPRDREGLCAALRHLCADDAERTVLQRRASQRAKRYGASVMAESYLRVYRELLGIPEDDGRSSRKGDVAAGAFL